MLTAVGLDWTSKANERSELQTFALNSLAVWPTALSFVSITAGILIVYSPRLPKSPFPSPPTPLPEPQFLTKDEVFTATVLVCITDVALLMCMFYIQEFIFIIYK